MKRERPPKVNGKNVINQSEDEKNKLGKLQHLQEAVKDSIDIQIE